MTRTRTAACSVVAAAAVLALAAPAHAHVTVDPDEAAQGGYTTLNIKVPNERDDASTVRLEVHLDEEHPLASVMPQPVPGWDVEVTTAALDEPIEVHGSPITEAPSVITWSGGEISPGTFQQFPLSIGPLPEGADQLVFKAIQTYDSDEVVRWIEEPVEGEAEPEHPAALLALTPGEDGHGTDDAANADDEPAATGADAEGDAGTEAGTETGAASDTTDTPARVLAGVGIAIGIAGVAFGVLAGRRRAPADPA
jgi:uncharacterized protein YcnI